MPAGTRASRRTKARARSYGRVIRSARTPQRKSLSTLARRRAVQSGGGKLRDVSAARIRAAEGRIVRQSRSVVVRKKGKGTRFYASPRRGGKKLAPSQVRRGSAYAVRLRTHKTKPHSVACVSARKHPVVSRSGRVVCRKRRVSGWAKATRAAYALRMISSVRELKDPAKRIAVYRLGLRRKYPGLTEAGLTRMRHRVGILSDVRGPAPRKAAPAKSASQLRALADRRRRAAAAKRRESDRASARKAPRRSARRS